MPVRINEIRHFNGAPTAVTASASAATATGLALPASIVVGAKAGSGTTVATGTAYDPTVVVSNTRRLLVGTTPPGGAINMAAEETNAGASLDASRVFVGGIPTNFMSTAGSQDVTPGRVTVFSFKPDIPTLAAGTALNGQINTLLDSIPIGHKCALCIWHEPEDNTAGSHSGADPAGWSYQQYRDAYARFADLVHATGRSELKTIWIMMAYTWKLSSNRDPDLWYPGNSYVDLVGIDSYNEGSLSATQRWDSPGFGYGAPDPTESLSPVGGGYVDGGFLSWTSAKGKSWITCEVGTIRRLSGTKPQWCTDNNVSWTKAGWLGYAADFWAAQPGCVGVLYFDHSGRTWSGTPTESWQLGNDTTGTDYAAWGDFAKKYGYRANSEAVVW